ncbi:MAG: lipase family protein [Nocardioides sp.]|uniref:lipase family protein n=1 Tax=Nocardioides sp. TaxID=35761 RepID=UPI003F09A235
MKPLSLVRVRRGVIASAVALAGVAASLVATPATAAPSVPEPPRPAFYEAPATLPAANGALIRSEKLTYKLDPADVATHFKNSHRILYRSTNRAGEAIAVSGVVIVPNGAWIGLGKRPIISYAAGTQGMADKCAPSRQFSEGIEYEAIGVAKLLARGYAVVMTDYEGLGTAGVHTYMDRVSQGRAVLDAVRAAQQLGISGITSANPVGLEGYSQGGGAAASAVELAGSYAPELKIKGAIVGAVPADLGAVANNLEGTLWSAFSFFALRGLAESYDLDMSPYLNAEGKQVFADVEQDCVFDLFSTAFKQSKDLSANGQPMAEIMKNEPLKSIVEAQRIGTIKPTVPVLVDHSRLDDTIPFSVGKQMAKSWCNKGANVRFVPNVAPLHVGGMLPHWAQDNLFWEARFNGLPQINNCWTI